MAAIGVNVDDDVKRNADRLFRSMGLNLSTAINVFLRKSLAEGGIPFSLTANVRGVWVDPSRVLEPRRLSDGSAVLPTDWDDEEDAVYDALHGRGATF